MSKKLFLESPRPPDLKSQRHCTLGAALSLLPSLVLSAPGFGHADSMKLSVVVGMFTGFGFGLSALTPTGKRASVSRRGEDTEKRREESG